MATDSGRIHLGGNPSYVSCTGCAVPVTRTLLCGHEATMPCKTDPGKFLCQQMVPAADTPCGHAFDVPCHEPPAEQRCPEDCDVRLDCGHSCDRKCHTQDDPDHIQYECHLPCLRTRPGCTEHTCLHQCADQCDEKCNRPCLIKVDKVIEGCQHIVKVECRTKPHGGNCTSVCKRVLLCGHRCQRLCRLPCAEVKDCVFLVEDAIKLVCGHKLSLPCNVLARGLPAHSEELLARCKAPCRGVLGCGHACAGTCGDCLQGRVHVRCKQACGRELVCGHVCKAGCADSCPPCSSPCAMRCVHSRCGKLCGVPCTPCKMPCSRRCLHGKCFRRCDEECDVEPCVEPCTKQLHCGHACMGFCGEPCPPLCRTCRPDEVSEMLFGDEDRPNARFVLLTDCGHSVEAGGMERWLREGGAEERVPCCPHCKHNIVSTQRVKGLVRTALADIMNVKKILFGVFADNENNRKALKQILDDLKMTNLVFSEMIPGGKFFEMNSNEIHDVNILMEEKLLLFNTINKQLLPERKKRKVHHSKFELGDLRVKTEILADVHSLKTLSSLEGGSLGDRAMLAARASRILHSLRNRALLCGEEVGAFGFQVCLLQRLDQIIRLSNAVRGADVNAELTCAKARAKLLTAHLYTEKEDKKMDVELQPLIKKWLDKTSIRVMGRVAMNMGSWYKCPNGHFYFIDGCGNPVEEGRCIDCVAIVGGFHEQRRSDNVPATEMDAEKIQ